MKYEWMVLAASAIAFAACSVVEDSSGNEGLVSEEEGVRMISFEAPHINSGDDAETRSTLIPNGDYVSFAWEASDTVGIYPDKGAQVFFSMEGGVGSNVASFNGGGWALRQNSTYYCYYPFVGDVYMDKDKIPVSFSGQKQTGYSSFGGAKFYLASEGTSSENGALKFTFEMLNTIIRIRATLPAGTYTKASLTTDETLFVTEGTYSLDDRTIIGTDYSSTLSIDLDEFTLSEETSVLIYFLSAPVDLREKELKIRIFSADGTVYSCSKNPSKAYDAGTWYGLACTMSEDEDIINFADPEVKRICVELWDTNGDGELDKEEAAATGAYPFSQIRVGNLFRNNTHITSFDELKYFIGITEFSFWAFYGCTNLRSIYIPKAVSFIEDDEDLLLDLDNLTSIVVDPENTYYDSRDNCNAIIWTSTNSLCFGCKGTTIPETVKSISWTAFWRCSGLENITIPNSVTYLSGFQNCTGLTSITIPDSVTSINAFNGCSGLTSITIPNSVTYLSGFQNCTGLASITIPNSVTTIGDYTFSNCTGLSSITIPDSVTSIEGYHAFSNCTGLSSITIQAVNPPAITGYDYTNLMLFEYTNDCPIYVPAGSVEAYKVAKDWCVLASRIQAITGGETPEVPGGGED